MTDNNTARVELLLTDEQVKYMVERFLRWRLPDDFCPDAGISFKREFNENTPWPGKHEPSGTNLFDYTQATGMVRHMVEGMPVPSTQIEATGEDELVAQLRSYIPCLVRQGDQAYGPLADDITEAADRIATLTAERDATLSAVMEAGQAHVHRAIKAEAQLTTARQTIKAKDRVIAASGDAITVADRLIERGYGLDVPDEWHVAFKTVVAAIAITETKP
jgi:hypothetical protein